ncbi:MAG: zf-HC2 domain-containing protein [Betaproteobacteria bacterium]
MFCDEALDAVEAIAAGELTPEGRIAAHLASCPNCAAALDAARRVEGLLRRRPVPRTPPQFTSRTMTLVRRRRWRSEQYLDAGFNLALAVVAVITVGLVWILLHQSGVAAASGDATGLFSAGVTALARRIVPTLPLYAGATALVAAAVGIWWWAERDAAI